ncbi:type VI secretion system lipoprotein TssJ [Achromobacter sp. 77]|uniref:type VI secretion system lipoprotein TssJ n=1 Tax=Achromobacter TaxID=222 RepID=UPI001D02D6C7|nr:MULTISPECIES: type VI secretion system lipoprotein TssJ [Achromobacter]MCP2516578.1 type VI secretion system lipoprotein TssJ [Achromobacter mucicolens]MCU6614922.1 type VI secretion system lipoprotein TssJ [Achromobacter mucicolens]UDG76727.1 type VI secretion system lipoprotein TssJ [Achromobacter sp. 77]
MKRPILAGLAVSMLVGCGTVGEVLTKTGQILMDPSIPVGAPDDQPSLIGLSLYAADDVNPNPESAHVPQPADLSGTAQPGGDASGDAFEISLRSGNRHDLIGELRALLDELEDTAASPQSMSRVDRGSSRVSQARVVVALSPLPARFDVSPHYLPNRGFGAPAAAASQHLTSAPSPLALVDEDIADPQAHVPARGLGQYSQGLDFAALPPAPPSRSLATPIAFKVLQLKDDSLLLNADPLLLAKDLEKALGTTFVTQDDYVLQPGQFKYIDFARIRPDTRYVAIVADFHAQNGAVWKQAFRLEPKGRRYALLLTLSGTRVAITDESHRPLQSSSNP